MLQGKDRVRNPLLLRRYHLDVVHLGTVLLKLKLGIVRVVNRDLAEGLRLFQMQVDLFISGYLLSVQCLLGEVQGIVIVYAVLVSSQ